MKWRRRSDVNTVSRPKSTYTAYTIYICQLLIQTSIFTDTQMIAQYHELNQSRSLNVERIKDSTVIFEAPSTHVTQSTDAQCEYLISFSV